MLEREMLKIIGWESKTKGDPEDNDMEWFCLEDKILVSVDKIKKTMLIAFAWRDELVSISFPIEVMQAFCNIGYEGVRFFKDECKKDV